MQEISRHPSYNVVICRRSAARLSDKQKRSGSMSEFFPNVPQIKYEGRDSKNRLAFKYYDPQRVILGKMMEEMSIPPLMMNFSE